MLTFFKVRFPPDSGGGVCLFVCARARARRARVCVCVCVCVCTRRIPKVVPLMECYPALYLYRHDKLPAYSYLQLWQSLVMAISSYDNL